MKLIFASNNKGKIAEVQSLIKKDMEVIAMADAGITENIPEPYHTFRENAWAKADYIFRKTGQDCFAEDSGLVVPALNGEPGVFSARYSGEGATDQSNNEKLLHNIRSVDDKYAYYQAVICILLDKEIHYFEGKCEGSLTLSPRGEGGFGYDPLFIPKGFDRTFAEISLSEKNRISHRAEAVKKLIAFLNTL